MINALTSGSMVKVNANYAVRNLKLAKWVSEVVALCKPDYVQWCDGSQQEFDALVEHAKLAGQARDWQGARQAWVKALELTPPGSEQYRLTKARIKNIDLQLSEKNAWKKWLAKLGPIGPAITVLSLNIFRFVTSIGDWPCLALTMIRVLPSSPRPSNALIICPIDVSTNLMALRRPGLGVAAGSR